MRWSGLLEKDLPTSILYTEKIQMTSKQKYPMRLADAPVLVSGNTVYALQLRQGTQHEENRFWFSVYMAPGYDHAEGEPIARRFAAAWNALIGAPTNTLLGSDSRVILPDLSYADLVEQNRRMREALQRVSAETENFIVEDDGAVIVERVADLAKAALAENPTKWTPEQEELTIDGNVVSLAELQADVEAAQSKFHYRDFCFTHVTVAALVQRLSKVCATYPSVLNQE
jgi:hypothetical protein